MKRFLTRHATASVAVMLCSSLLALAQAPVNTAPPPVATQPAAKAPPSDPAVPSPRPGNWISRHEGFLAELKNYSDAKVLFVGDSITDGWRGHGRRTFAEYYTDLKTFNIGISGDRTEHVLWRLDNGEVAGLSPKVTVVMIGTNNSGGKEEEITRGVKAVVASLREKLPQSKILLLAIFPRGEKADNGARVKLKAVNVELAKLDDGNMIKFLDIGDKFLEADGTLPKSIMPDALHPNAQGYEIWAQAMNPTLEKLLGEKIVKHELPPEPTKPARPTPAAPANK